MKYKHRFNSLKLKVIEIYFEEHKFENERFYGSDIVRLIQCKNMDQERPENFITILIELNQTLDHIKSKFKKTLRYDINKAYRFNFSHSAIDKKTDIRELLQKLDKFLRSKGLPVSNKKKLLELFQQGFLRITCLQDEATSSNNWHFYLVASEYHRARLLYSFCSEDRQSGYDLNKVHMFEDIKLFQEAGCMIFDLGGVTSIERPSGIDKFKLAFQGTVERSYTGSIGISLRGKLALSLYSVVSNLRRFL